MPLIKISFNPPWGKKNDQRKKQTKDDHERAGIATELAGKRLDEERKRHNEELRQVSSLIARARLLTETDEREDS